MNEKGVVINNNGLLLDPDNAFWGILNQNQDGYCLVPRRILSLYEKVKDNLDIQMQDFRFSANLTAIYIDPTDKCNANCPYCYIPSGIRKKGRSMTKEELFLVLDKAAGYFSAEGGSASGGKGQKRKPVIVFHAAEPLLVKDIIFEGIVKYNNKFKFGLQTNASLLEKKDVEFLKKSQVGVGISLDYYSPDVNDRLRPSYGKNGNFHAASRAIDWFNGYEGMNVITTITKFNVSGLTKMVEFLHKKMVPCVLLNPVRLTQENSRFLKPEESLMAENFIAAVNKAIELSKKSRHRIIIGNFTNVILGIVAPAARRLMCDISPCGGGRCFLTITASGEMIPCGEFIGLKGFSGGNIFSAKGGSFAAGESASGGACCGRKSQIKQAMQSKPFKRIRERIVEKIDECKSCALRNICGAPCPAELYSLGKMYPVRSPHQRCNSRQKQLNSNGMYRKSVFCEFYKQIISHAFKLISEGKEKYCFRKEGLNNLEYEYKL